MQKGREERKGEIKMAVLSKKIDFVSFVWVSHANCNGDPMDGNRPRIDVMGFGEISDVCLKRKIRNRMQDLGYRIFVQSEDRSDDGHETLKSRAEAVCGVWKKEKEDKEGKESYGAERRKAYRETACGEWLDVRSFGQVFAFPEDKKEKTVAVSVGVRGPVTIQRAVSVDPIDIESMQITKSVSNEVKEGKDRGSDTMGMKHVVRYGLYKFQGSINVQLAEGTGFTEEDAAVLKECLRTLFVNDASAARPEGSMEVYKLFWFEHKCKLGDHSSAKVHRSVEAKLAEGIEEAVKPEDYVITYTPLEGLEPEIIDGV